MTLPHGAVVGSAVCDCGKIICARREKTYLLWFANNKGADHPAHPRSLVSAFVTRVLQRILSRLAMSEILIFWLVSVAEENGLSLALSETPKIGFLATGPISYPLTF